MDRIGQLLRIMATISTYNYIIIGALYAIVHYRNVGLPNVLEDRNSSQVKLKSNIKSSDLYAFAYL